MIFVFQSQLNAWTMPFSVVILYFRSTFEQLIANIPKNVFESMKCNFECVRYECNAGIDRSTSVDTRKRIPCRKKYSTQIIPTKKLLKMQKRPIQNEMSRSHFWCHHVFKKSKTLKTCKITSFCPTAKTVPMTIYTYTMRTLTASLLHIVICSLIIIIDKFRWLSMFLCLGPNY